MWVISTQTKCRISFTFAVIKSVWLAYSAEIRIRHYFLGNNPLYKNTQLSDSHELFFGAVSNLILSAFY